MTVSRSPISMDIVRVDDLDKIIKSAWMTSRPKVSEIYYLEVLSIDTPVSELGGIVVELEVPIIVREIICSPRDHIVWAQTSRVQDLHNWTVPDTISAADLKSCITQNDIMLDKKKKGVPQDTYRQELPLSYLTKFTARISLRTWMKYVLFFQRIRDQAPESTKDFWHDVYKMFYDGLKEITEHFFNFTDMEYNVLLSKIKMIDYLPRIKNEDIDESIATSNEIAIRVTAPIALRAQVVRHRPLHVVDNLIDVVLSENMMTINISHSVHMSISATNETWKHVVGSRTCWMAQFDIWYPIVEKVTKILGIKSMLIPCMDGSCPYGEDARQRERKLDPGLPCPRFTTLHGVTKDLSSNFDLDKLRGEQREYVEETGRSIQYWSDQIKY